MGYHTIDEIIGNYRVISSSIHGNLELIQKAELEGWKLFSIDSSNITSYYYFKRVIEHRFTAQDRGRIDEIIKALKFLEKDQLLNYSLEIDFLNNIRSW